MPLQSPQEKSVSFGIAASSLFRLFEHLPPEFAPYFTMQAEE
jgi:hypothetical protein